jgi:hypothetical protein
MMDAIAAVGASRRTGDELQVVGFASSVGVLRAAGDLEDHRPLHARRTSLFDAIQLGVDRAIHLAHSASAQLGENLVGTQRFPNHNQIPAWATAPAPRALRI